MITVSLLVDAETNGMRLSTPGSQSENPSPIVPEFNEIWTRPTGWNGPAAVLYRSLDDVTELVFMEGSQRVNMVPMVSGQVGL